MGKQIDARLDWNSRTIVIREQATTNRLQVLDENVAEPVLEPLVQRIGGDDLAVEERHGHRVVLAAKREDAGLPLQADQLEDVGEAEVLQSSFECHRAPSTSQ